MYWLFVFVLNGECVEFYNVDFVIIFFFYICFEIRFKGLKWGCGEGIEVF